MKTPPSEKGHEKALEQATVKQYCKTLKIPVIGANFARVAEEAVEHRQSHVGYLKRCWRWNQKNATVTPLRGESKTPNCHG